MSTSLPQALTTPAASPLLSSSEPAADLEGGCGLSDSERRRLLEPFAYLTRLPGKGVRPRLIDAFNRWLRIDTARLERIKGIVEELHNASLLIDDIEDNSKLRRGAPAAHLIYGVPSCINGANYVYFLAMKNGLELGGDKVVKIFIEELIALHEGQGQDIMWRDCNECPTEAQYRDMVINKTGGLFRLSVRLMQVFSHDTETDYLPLVTTLGLYFQVLDDYINLRSAAYHRNKSFCEDITEGKFSFPTVHHIRAVASDPADRRVISILKQRTEDPELKKYAVRCLEETGSFSYTLDVLKELEVDLKAKIDDLGGNDALLSIIEKLSKQREGEVGIEPPE